MIENQDQQWSKYSTETVAGIDLSLRSPCLCIIKPTTKPNVVLAFEDCQFHYLTDHKYSVVDEGNVHGSLIGSWSSEEERYESISEWVIKVLKQYNCTSTGLEGYAYGAANPTRLAQLIENQGLLKYHMWKEGIGYNIFTPSSIKKMATSNGRSTKDQMYDAWLKDTGVCLQSIFGRDPDGKIKSPVSDIVDSFYIACSQRIDMIQTNYYFKEGNTNARDISKNEG